MTKLLFASLFAFVLFSQSVEASPKMSGLPLPRFVSLRSDQVNLRTGPGVRYPVEWVYLKRDMPIEIIAEFDNWRKVRDWEGSEGWIHQTMLSGRRTIRVTGIKRTLYNKESKNASATAHVESGVIGKLLQCPKRSAYCRVEIDEYKGWLKRGEFWGIYAGEHLEK